VHHLSISARVARPLNTAQVAGALLAGVMDPDGPVENFLVVTAPVVGLVYLPAFVLRASAKLHRLSRKMIVATMASEITSATVFVSSTSTTSASRPRPPATTNRQSFNLLTATTRLTRSLLQSVRSHVGRSSATAWSSPARAGLRLAMPSGDVCSDWLRPRTVVNQAVEPAHASVRIGRCYSSTRSLFAQRQLSRPNLRKVHGPHGVLARRPGVVHHYRHG